MSTNHGFTKQSTAASRRTERFNTDLTFPLIFCAVEAAVLLIFTAALNLFFNVDGKSSTTRVILLAIILFYIFSAGTVSLLYLLRASKTKKALHEANQIQTETYDMFKYVIDLPYAIVSAEGSVKIMNGALQDILGYKNAISGIDFSEICSIPMKNIIAGAKNKDDYLAETIYDLPGESAGGESTVARLADARRYEVISYILKVRGENYYFTVFKDVEDYMTALEREADESPVVAYILLDNLQELTQYIRADYRAASAEIENILQSWVAEMNGFIREYDNDKYVAVFSKKELDRQMHNDFEIQHRIMDLEIGDNSFPVTISMGIASRGESIRDIERDAHHALNVAIKRGGNQVAVKREDSTGYIFFGGTHKTMEKNTAIQSRVSKDILEDRIKSASNVLIMGHTNPDFDSIGSCVGMARFAMSVLKRHSKSKALPEERVNIVVNRDSETFSLCFDQLSQAKIYEDIFIGHEAARDLVTPETVLIICDVNNPAIYESPELAEAVSQIAVIDHHRLASTLPFEPFLQYIETTKSSASEIVTEILFSSEYSNDIQKGEAELLLSGIMLDTNSFTRNAGSQTFDMVHNLYSKGAHTEVVREFFNESVEELMLSGEFESRAQIYRNNVAITWMTLDRPATPEDRIVASKVADKLLKIKGVQASFALLKIDNDVVISGRSKGDVNVQLILERLKGGGHFDAAGAQVRDVGLGGAREMLTDAIDNYFEYDHRNEDDK